MNYYDLRRHIAKIIPRRLVLDEVNYKIRSAIKEKGRKTNYRQFDFGSDQWIKNERLLNTEEFRNFIEVSLRASACPMPLNADVWDGTLCAYRCKYCYADAFRASLYTSFFDNAKTMGYRSCSPDYFKFELGKYFNNRGKKSSSEIQNAITNNIPIRLGIRFEDFHPLEKKKGVALEFLKYLAASNYPVMVNTKSDLIADDSYLKALTDNPVKAAVHITLISSDNEILKKLEPAAPSYERRLEAMRRLVLAGIRTIARIEPYMVFINDKKNSVQKYIEEVYEAGVRNITFDTYSYSANNPGIRANYINEGYDYNRMFLLTSDSQGIGSLLLNRFMDLFRQKGFSCSTFDLGNVPSNNQTVCCEVGDWFVDSKFNHGSVVGAIRYIQSQGGKEVAWGEYEKFVNKNGGFLSERLKEDIFEIWNLTGNLAYAIENGQGIVPSKDSGGNIKRKYVETDDFRMDILEGCL